MKGVLQGRRGAKEQAGDRVWGLRTGGEYHDELESDVAEVASCGGRGGGAVTGARLRAGFARKCNWAHQDIAGAEAQYGKDKGATGRPVPLLTQYLLDRSGV